MFLGGSKPASRLTAAHGRTYAPAQPELGLESRLIASYRGMKVAHKRLFKDDFHGYVAVFWLRSGFRTIALLICFDDT